MCKHERLRTVGDRVFCCACNEELTIEFLMGKNKAENPSEEVKQGKSTSRKRTAKKAD